MIVCAMAGVVVIIAFSFGRQIMAKSPSIRFLESRVRRVK
jgi:hypothetical protein